MTLTIDTTPESEAILAKESMRRGVPVEQLAREVFAEAIEDLEDAEDARSILAETNPAEWRTLDDLRQAVRE